MAMTRALARFRHSLLVPGIQTLSHRDAETAAKHRKSKTNKQHKIDNMRRPWWGMLSPGAPRRPDDKTEYEQDPEQNLYDHWVHLIALVVAISAAHVSVVKRPKV
jgi:hypothetical protein